MISEPRMDCQQVGAVGTEAVVAADLEPPVDHVDDRADEHPAAMSALCRAVASPENEQVANADALVVQVRQGRFNLA